MDLTSTYLGLELKNPILLGACPLGTDLGVLRQLEDAGCAGVVLPSLFEEEILAAVERVREREVRFRLRGRVEGGPLARLVLRSAGLGVDYQGGLIARALADRMEAIAFNALPATFSPESSMPPKIGPMRGAPNTALAAMPQMKSPGGFSCNTSRTLFW